MTLDETIKHAEEVAKKQENNAKNYPRPDRSVRGSGKKYNAYLKSAEEHEQIAEWLKDYKRLLEQQPCEDVPDINNGNIYKCSCGYGWDKSKVVRHHFCPNCGRAVDKSRMYDNYEKACEFRDKVDGQIQRCFCKSRKYWIVWYDMAEGSEE